MDCRQDDDKCGVSNDKCESDFSKVSIKMNTDWSSGDGLDSLTDISSDNKSSGIICVPACKESRNMELMSDESEEDSASVGSMSDAKSDGSKDKGNGFFDSVISYIRDTDMITYEKKDKVNNKSNAKIIFKMPDDLEVVYKKDYNILSVHDIIMKKFIWEEQVQLPELKKKIIELYKLLPVHNSIIQKKATKREIVELERKIKDIENSVKKSEYIMNAKHLVSEYKKIGSISNVVSFEKNDKMSIETVENNVDSAYRHSLIQSYINLARRYININVVREPECGFICNGCGEDLENNSVVDDGIILCLNCNTEKISIIRSPFYKDSVRVSNTRNNYEDRENFMKALKRFQGKQINKPPSELYIELEHYFITKGHPSSDEYKGKPLTSDGKKDGTSRDLMYTALYDTGNSIYYEDINLILHNYWGWALIDLGHLEYRIMRDYDLTQRIYNDIPKKRKSSLNSQFRLFKHLRRYQDEIKYPIRARDFKIPTTRAIFEWHENIWQKIEKIAWDV